MLSNTRPISAAVIDRPMHQPTIPPDAATSPSRPVELARALSETQQLVPGSPAHAAAPARASNGAAASGWSAERGPQGKTEAELSTSYLACALSAHTSRGLLPSNFGPPISPKLACSYLPSPRRKFAGQFSRPTFLEPDEESA